MKAERTLTVLLRCIEETARAEGAAESCAAVVEAAVALFGVSGAWIQREDGDAGSRVVHARGAAPAFLESAAAGSPWPAGAAAPGQPGIVVIEAGDSARGSLAAALRAGGLGAATFVPMTARGRLIGALVMLERSAHAWAPEEKEVAVAIARLAAGSLARDREAAARLRLERELLTGRRLENVGHIAGGVAHDFNNMLTAMIGYMDLVSAGLPPDTEEQGYLAQALDAADQATELTRQMLGFARRQPEPRTPQNLNALLERCAPLLRRLLPEGVSLVARPAAEQAWVLADSGQLEQVLVSLALRAREALSAGGVLTLSVIDVPGAGGGPAQVALEAVDTGAPADPAALRRAIGPPESSGDDGRDVQLAVAASLVHASGGRLEGGRAAAGGTRLLATWPLTAAQEPRPEPGGAARGGLETVLFVEDDSSMRELAGRMLVRLGYDVLTAGGADEALEALARRPGGVHLLIADLVLPGMSGRDLALRARESRPGLRVLLTSGYAVSPGATEVAGGLPFLPKPFSIETLARRVRETIDAPPAGAVGAPE